MSDFNFQAILKKYWGYDDFRGIQRDIIESIGAGHDTLGLMPTGGGKSITFQVPALAMEGICIVITPLIALMKDQVHHLRQLGIQAEAIFSGMQHDDILRILENSILGNVKLLYVSPERLSSALFQKKLSHMHVSFFTVDEAHCISQWGYDFRPTYLEIANIRLLHPQAPMLALTATATPRVVEDIQDKLALPSTTNTQHPSFTVFRMSFERKNLAYKVQLSPDKYQELVHILMNVEGSAIVYVHTRRHAREVSEHLSEAGLSSTFYHAGLEHGEKDHRQRDWQHDRIRIMVATNAFGMGIDKPDVRIVIHYDCPDSIEAYFQEAGRAGRDGLPAQAILLYNGSDRGKLHKRIVDNYPEKDYVRQVYEHLAYYYQIATGDGYGVLREFNIDEFCQRFHHFPVRVHAALQLLTRAGYIDYDEAADRQARVRFLISRDQLYRLDEVSPQEDRVIVTLLRTYGGLFADEVYIDESTIARQAELTTQQVYNTLRTLSMRHLIRFVPRSTTPTIRYMQRREDTEHLILPPNVYEQRRQQYQQRIEAMLHYVTSEDTCRSRQLLAYFGEQTRHDCHQCDVCLRNEGGNSTQDKPRDIRQKILQLLADGQRHHITELLQLTSAGEALNEVLYSMMQEEELVQQDGFLVLNTLSVQKA